jgi:hypothetical protein
VRRDARARERTQLDAFNSEFEMLEEYVRVHVKSSDDDDER